MKRVSVLLDTLRNHHYKRAKDIDLGPEIEIEVLFVLAKPGLTVKSNYRRKEKSDFFVQPTC